MNLVLKSNLWTKKLTETQSTDLIWFFMLLETKLKEF